VPRSLHPGPELPLHPQAEHEPSSCGGIQPTGRRHSSAFMESSRCVEGERVLHQDVQSFVTLATCESSRSHTTHLQLYRFHFTDFIYFLFLRYSSHSHYCTRSYKILSFDGISIAWNVCSRSLSRSKPYIHCSLPRLLYLLLVA
jgi:hypothetical protein